MHNNWAPPSNPFEEEPSEKLSAYEWAVVRTGLYFLVISTLLGGVAIWGVAKILNNSGIISGHLSWHGAVLISGLGLVTGLWKKTFFK